MNGGRRKFYPQEYIEFITPKAYIALYAFNAMKIKHKSYYILILSITSYMVWAHTAVMLKLGDRHNCLILHQIKYIPFFQG